MDKVSAEEMRELYLERVFDSSDDLEDAALEEAFFNKYGWTTEEFDEYLAEHLY